MQVVTKTEWTNLYQDKIDFKWKIITRDKEGHYIMKKGSVHYQDKTTVNVYAVNIELPEYITQILINQKDK